MDNLYEEVNGQWLAEHVIPADRGVDGTFHKLRDDSEAHVHALLEASSGLPGQAFRSFMDTDRMDAAGIAPLDDDFALLSLPLTEALGKLSRLGVSSPVEAYITKDSSSEEVVLYVVQGGLGLPDEAYYREHPEVLAAYEQHVARMLGFLGKADLAPAAIALEKKLAAAHWDVVAARDSLKTYNPCQLSELPPRVAEILRAAGIPEGRVVNMMPSFLTALDELLENEDWEAWLTWHILNSRAAYLTSEISAANWEFYGRRLTGATQQRDRWKRGVTLAESLVGEAIGQEYVAQHFPPSHKEAMEELVDSLLRAYRDRISQLAWMTPETRERALEKLGTFKAKIGYPDTWRSFAGLEFGPDLLENVRAASAFNHDYELAKLGKPADRDEWVTTPQTVNAFYNPVVNDITFPAAILRAPFFDPDASAATNFGAIGAVIGHEIGHGFDDQGSLYDGAGNLNSWWTDEDREAFTELTAKLVTQFDGLVPTVLAGREGIRGVNGEFTLGENIGDLGGLGIAVTAFLQSGGAREDLPELFRSWARIWRTAIRPELAEQYLAIDPHSPAEFRCNVIAANIDEFYEAFEVGEMAIPAEDRVRIW
ncbi:M13 family metallopeptidase [Corynebacterium epidermidicanis]|uniref:Putative metalloendopeptidase n=1 Tax=Corynebacterium epidermidicanis TaxID=1050174 RepID=A0A0G3GLN5_9CORY|nr:M13-type metalloendopeptidase [Corynebacterium epidermidicanis]AKK02084.1 putative metalloendopeptidase [Corynebacterium epidermidicanis]